MLVKVKFNSDKQKIIDLVAFSRSPTIPGRNRWLTVNGSMKRFSNAIWIPPGQPDGGGTAHSDRATRKYLIWVRNRNASPFVLSIEARQVYGSAAPRAVCKGGSYIGDAEQKVINHINSSYERSVSNFPNWEAVTDTDSLIYCFGTII